jgi:uncharacterized protein (DUF433 family)
MTSSIIVSNPAILSAEPVFRGTRVPFKSLTDYLEHGRTLSEFLEDFPSVTSAEAIAALEGARTSLTATLTAVGKQECDLPGFSGKDKGDLLALAEERLDVLVTIARTLDISRT